MSRPIDYVDYQGHTHMGPSLDLASRLAAPLRRVWLARLGTHVVEPIMPKAKTKRKRKLATKVRTLTKSSLAGNEEWGHDTDGDGYLGEDDVDFLKGLGEEGRLTFLRDLAP